MYKYKTDKDRMSWDCRQELSCSFKSLSLSFQGNLPIFNSFYVIGGQNNVIVSVTSRVGMTAADILPDGQLAWRLATANQGGLAHLSISLLTSKNKYNSDAAKSFLRRVAF